MANSCRHLSLFQRLLFISVLVEDQEQVKVKAFESFFLSWKTLTQKDLFCLEKTGNAPEINGRSIAIHTHFHAHFSYTMTRNCYVF